MPSNSESAKKRSIRIDNYVASVYALRQTLSSAKSMFWLAICASRHDVGLATKFEKLFRVVWSQVFLGPATVLMRSMIRDELKKEERDLGLGRKKD